MKILLIAGMFPKLSETFVFDQAIFLQNKGIDLTVLSLHKSTEAFHHVSLDAIEGKIVSANIPLNRSGLLQKFPRAFVKASRRYGFVRAVLSINVHSKAQLMNYIQLIFVLASLSKNDYDILYCHFGYSGVLASALKKFGFKGKIVTVFHGFDMSSKEGWNTAIYKELFSTGDLFLPVSEHWRSKLIAAGCPAKKTITHHLGVNIDLFSFKARSLPISRPMRYLTVARLVSKKGHEIVLEALKILRAKGYDFHYSIVGSGPLERSLKEKVSNLELIDHVSFEGSKDHAVVTEIMQSSDVFILASNTANDGDSEGIPIVLMEALALGLPTVSTYHSGIPELIENPVSGILAQENDSKSLDQGLIWLNENTN